MYFKMATKRNILYMGVKTILLRIVLSPRQVPTVPTVSVLINLIDKTKLKREEGPILRKRQN